ncbi:MAG: N-acetylmuramoyl-L-alanine amidase [Pseudomonadota bacterium]
MLRLFFFLGTLWAVAPALAQDLSALARLDGISIEEDAQGTSLSLSLSQPVPWRVFLVDGPPRFVMDFNTLSIESNVDVSAMADVVEHGLADNGWTRIVVDLSAPHLVQTAGMVANDDGTAGLHVRLTPTDPVSFAATARPGQAGIVPQAAPRGRPVLVIDPGHGGLDPGAEVGDLNEKVLMLAVARELEETLIRGGVFDVVLTRERDEFVPLETRLTRARAAGADVFVSLHADELPDGAGEASGITVYTLASGASDDASRRLAERHNKNDLVTGVTDTAPGDEIALVLMDMARRDTAPRSEALAEALRDGFRAEGLALAGRPLRSAAFSVLKAPDIPSVLIELGFLSSEVDRARLVDPMWRAAAVRAIETALVAWSREDAAQAGLRRR